MIVVKQRKAKKKEVDILSRTSFIPDYHYICNQDTPRGVREALHIGDIYANQVMCNNCKELVRSKNRHNFACCSCGGICVDGGSFYLKRSGKLDGYTELSELFTDAREEAEADFRKEEEKRLANQWFAKMLDSAL